MSITEESINAAISMAVPATGLGVAMAVSPWAGGAALTSALAAFGLGAGMLAGGGLLTASAMVTFVALNNKEAIKDATVSRMDKMKSGLIKSIEKLEVKMAAAKVAFNEA